MAVRFFERSSKGICFRNGRGERIRTSDPLVPNQVRYQTALRPECDEMPVRECVRGAQASGCACWIAVTDWLSLAEIGSDLGEGLWEGEEGVFMQSVVCGRRFGCGELQGHL